MPINLMYQKVFSVDKQPLSLQAGGRVYVNRPEGGPDWGLRATMTLLFPKK